MDIGKEKARKKQKVSGKDFMSFLEPLCVILVTAGSRGEKLLFRYPFCLVNHVDGMYYQCMSQICTNSKQLGLLNDN